LKHRPGIIIWLGAIGSIGFLVFDLGLVFLAPFIGKARYPVLDLPRTWFVFHALFCFLFSGAVLGIIEWGSLECVDRAGSLVSKIMKDRYREGAFSLALAILAMAIIIPVSIMLFRGTGISRSRIAGIGPYLVSLTGLISIFALTWFLRRIYTAIIRRQEKRVLPAKMLGLIILSAVTTFLVYSDNYRYPGQYIYLHNLLFLICFIGFQFIALVAFKILPWTMQSRYLDFFNKTWRILIIGLVMMQIIISVIFLKDPRDKLFFKKDGMNYLKRFVLFSREITDFDRDGFSSFMGMNDPRIFDAGVHPFAYDIPDNGIDEDGLFGDSTKKEIAKYREIWKGTGLDAAAATDNQARKLSARVRDFNIIFVTVDALRFDRIRDFAEPDYPFPNFAALLRKSVVFTRMFSHGTGTAASLPVLFSSHYDWRTGVPPPGNLINRMGELGYTTIMVTLRGMKEFVNKDSQFDISSGFQIKQYGNGDGEEWAWEDGKLSAENITRETIRLLKKFRDEKLFIWVHYYEPHEWYRLNDPRMPLDRNKPHRSYDKLVAYIDEQIGGLLSALKDMGLEENTIIMLGADHGEGLGDRGILTHKYFIINQLIHIPFAIKIPGLSPGTAGNSPVGLVDVMPTILGFSGYAPEPGVLDGTSLAPLLVNPAQKRDKPVFINERYYKAVIYGRYKFVYDVAMHDVQLFDLDSDYEEIHDLWPEVEKPLKRHLYYLFLTSPFYGSDQEKPEI